MKPLGEWTDAELRDGVLRPSFGLHHREDFLGEMLRRERERCAVAVEGVAQKWFDGRRDGDAYDGFVAAVHAIRGLT